MSSLLKSTVLSASLLFTLTQPVSAAVWKDFEGLDTGLILLYPDMGASDIQKASRKMMASLGGRQSSALTRALINLEKKLAPEINAYKEELSRALKPYRVEGRPRYEQLESLLALARESNNALHKSYFINEALSVNQDLLPRLKAQVKKQNLSGQDRAALGVAALSLGYFTLHAIDYARELPGDTARVETRLGQKITQVRQKISANPFSAVQLGQELQFLLEAQGVMGRISKKTGQSLQQLPDSASELAGIITAVGELF